MAHDLFRKPVSTFRDHALSRYGIHHILLDHCVFVTAAARGGFGTETNAVACKTPVPTGVGNEKR
jgi:hypothetical protein